MTKEDQETSGDSAELLELIVESSTDFAIFTTDLAGHATSWNTGSEHLFGFTRADILRRTADLIFTPEDRRAGAPQVERGRALADGRALDERWHIRKDGSRFWASGLLMPLKNRTGFVKITRDRSEQHAAEERLRENEERFRVLATSIPQLVFRTRPDGRRTWPSPQWIDFTGQSFEASLGMGWLDAIHPGDREATQAAWAAAHERREYYVEHRVWRQADGEYRWHQTRARPIDGADGQGDWVGTMTDVHALRGLQGRQQVLMAELQHRTRNLLAVVQAIASQTIGRSETLAEFKVDFEGRLRALGRVQSLLARADHQDIRLRDLVEAELAGHAMEAVRSGAAVISGPDVAVPATSAQALALAVHELATNALKYGALARSEGRLTVTWSVVSDERQPRVVLDWRETGVSLRPEEAGRRKGYGTELIERALPYQLKARTRLDFLTDGVRCVIDVPMRGLSAEAMNG